MSYHNHLAPAYVAGICESVRALRQSNYCCILMGAAPEATTEASIKDRFAGHAARLQDLAANTFNRGLRAYYFALAMMMWFVNAWVFLAAAILYRREFKSKSLQTLKGALDDR